MRNLGRKVLVAGIFLSIVLPQVNSFASVAYVPQSNATLGEVLAHYDAEYYRQKSAEEKKYLNSIYFKDIELEMERARLIKMTKQAQGKDMSSVVFRFDIVSEDDAYSVSDNERNQSIFDRFNSLCARVYYNYVYSDVFSNR